MKQGVFYVMGVSGCGKSTIGKMLAEGLGIPYFDGDDYHPANNIAKMKAGNPLNDNDRYGWLLRLNVLAREQESGGAVIACSALKESYRDILSSHLNENCHWIYLEGTFETILQRLQYRKGHFMPESLLKSQFDILEIPTNAITVSIDQDPETILAAIQDQLT